MLAKTLTLPDLQPRCIIDTGIGTNRTRVLLPPAVEGIQEESIYQAPRFSIKPDKSNGSPVLMYRHYGLPPGATPQPQKDGSYTLELHDLHGIEEEPYMPPERALQGTVDFYYLRHGDLSNETAGKLLEPESGASGESRWTIS